MDNLQRLQGDVLVSLGLVVAVQVLQLHVQQVSKLLDVTRRMRELDEPLVTTLGIGIHKDGSCRIFQHLGTCLFAGIGQTTLGIVDNEFLAKGIDKALGAPGDDKLIGVDRGEADCVAYHVTPQATRGGYQHGVVLVFLHTPQRHDITSVHRLEFIEHAVVEHQQHRLVGRVVLQSEEALRSIISLHIMHVRRRDKLLILLTVRRKGHTSVEEHFQVRPHLFQMGLPRDFHHAVEYGEHPRRNTTDVGDILVHRLTGYPFTLYLEIAKQCGLLLWNTHQVG